MKALTAFLSILLCCVALILNIKKNIPDSSIPDRQISSEISKSSDPIIGTWEFTGIESFEDNKYIGDMKLDDEEWFMKFDSDGSVISTDKKGNKVSTESGKWINAVPDIYYVALEFDGDANELTFIMDSESLRLRFYSYEVFTGRQSDNDYSDYVFHKTY